MDREQRKEIELAISEVMESVVTRDYARQILEHEDDNGTSVMTSIIENVIETSAWEDGGYYNYDDIRMAIGRILAEKICCICNE